MKLLSDKKGNKSSGSHRLTQAVMLALVLILLNIISSYFFFRIDLTGDKRYTLTEPTKNLLKGVKDIISVKVLLDGEFPAGFKRLQQSAKEMLDDFRSVNPNITYDFQDPNAGTPEQINDMRAKFKELGIIPTNLRIQQDNKTEEKIIFPYAIVNYGTRKYIVNLLESNVAGTSPEVVLNNSVGLLEYKFANAIQKLLKREKQNILFTAGHGELQQLETTDLESTLRESYNTGRVNLDTIVQIKNAIDLLIVARPRTEFDEKTKFKIDQYVMNGGKVLWLIDKLAVSLDSLRRPGNAYVPYDYSLNLDDMLFKYGVRIQNNLILDMECSKIPLQTGMIGNTPQYDQFPWYYFPAVMPKSNNPIVKSLDRVNLYFPSTIDTIQTKTPVKKEILLASSKYSRLQPNTSRLNFEVLRYDPEPERFNKPYQPMAVLLEGKFPSLFENRVSPEMEAGLKELGMKFEAVSKETRMIVVSDGDIARNSFNPATGEMRPLGFNQYERRVYANKNFLINCVDYLIEGRGIIEARAREVKLRLLDTVKVRDEKGFWQLINVLLPVVLLVLAGMSYFWFRKKRYASN
ncbi:MAG TPA: gliding motility-associated ABC transporter substrate-binding protein GldG [Saprospiraceae bacterium]|nr:gliding motility-associated ABC transporter substrate-binding protein GldG [Saprospiraceae bacterium]MCC6687466.1 gliding motility-associated ABC transporter substrate-binding protein GldG [Saprospiraceae bacterium]HMV23155.1 gliding motility-associated ABC transporter substrate-binding protein GldG [Saprospiraceae bacterium]HMW75308.1 gliding motility-associated ABC transporter substrate-binding protein GldG [Saprospiraceae bacterium]HMX83145.1 gliding motility-associated ABC transporter su